MDSSYHVYTAPICNLSRLVYIPAMALQTDVHVTSGYKEYSNFPNYKFTTCTSFFLVITITHTCTMYETTLEYEYGINENSYLCNIDPDQLAPLTSS